jgi:hypothetical protein
MRCWLLLVLLASLTRHASADAPPRVVLELATPEPEQAAVRAALSEALDGAAVELQVSARSAIDLKDVITRRLEPEPPLARIWIDVTGHDQLAVYVTDGAWERVLIRLVPRAHNPAVDHEQVAQIVAAAVQALRDGARIGIERSAAQARLLPPPLVVQREPVRTAATATPPRARFPGAWLGAGYELMHQSREVPLLHAAGLELGAMLAAWAGAELGLELAFSARPARFTSQEVAARFDTLAVRWLGVISSRREQTVRLRVALGGGVDAVQLAPQRAPAGLAPSPKRVLLYGALRAALGPELDIMRFSTAGGEKLALAPVLLTDVQLSDTRYVVLDRGGEQVAFDPFRVQPGFALLLILR